jgi:DNA-binding CsgD family transcriptional regulator
MSDVICLDQLIRTELFVEFLQPLGAYRALTLPVAPPASGDWVYFMANKADPDFSADDLNFARHIQPGLAALFEVLRHRESTVAQAEITLTSRELTVLRQLATGQTAARISHGLSISSATVRKHLQHLYAKLGTFDRLGAVVRGLDLGLIRDDELSDLFRWDIHINMEG